MSNGLRKNERRPFVFTASGLAGSGKGTSMRHFKGCSEASGLTVELIDQGIKFRVMGEVALREGVELREPRILGDFIRSSLAQEAIFMTLREMSEMSDEEVEARLYTSEISTASGMVGKVEAAHEVAVGLLKSQVEAAAEKRTDIIIIDGRSVEEYAREYNQAGIANFRIGWYFNCDPVIAGRRRLSQFKPYKDMTDHEKQLLLKEVTGISDRNRSDIQREVNPLIGPMRAYHLDLGSYGTYPGTLTPWGRSRQIMREHNRLAVVDTSYTESIDEMTVPITQISMHSLYFAGLVGIEQIYKVTEGGFPTMAESI